MACNSSGTPAFPPVFASPRPTIEAGGISIPQLYEWHAKQNPDYPLFRFHNGVDLQTITHKEAILGIRRVARAVSSLVGSTERCVIGILANADTVTYSLTVLGILRAGHTAFPISPRNGAAAVAELLRRTRGRYLLVSKDGHASTLAQEALRSVDDVVAHPMFEFEHLFPSAPGSGDGLEVSETGLPTTYDLDAAALIIHSSGTTGHPKPVQWTHKGLVSWSTAAWFGEVDVTGAIVGVQAVPMFHALGISMTLVAAGSGWILATFRPTSPPTIPDPDNVFEAVRKTNTDYIITIPMFIEQWARDSEKVQHLTRIRGVIFGGAPLNKEVGDALASTGVTLVSGFGCTELGSVSNVLPKSPGMDWEYFTITPWLSHVVVAAGDGLHEIIAMSTPDHPLAVVNAKKDGVDGFTTSDLLVPHPTKHGLWKLHGRRDDQIILSNGEKTNPIPLEHIMNEDPHVHACVMFGRGRPQNGVLVQPAPDFQIDPHDEKTLEQFRNTIWATVERANKYAPQHSRIFKEMILVTSEAKPFTYSTKGAPRRVTILQDYKDEIDKLYVTVEQSAQSDIVAPSEWDREGVLTFVRAVVESVLKPSKPLPQGADLFQNGGDSLQATWIRNTILRALREHSPASAKKLPMNLVFQAPSITALSDAVLTSLGDSSGPTSATTAEDLVALAERYTNELQSRPTRATLRPRSNTRDVILLTGTTGGFGCDILEHLLREDEVAMVYAFNRRDSKAADRQRAQFRAREHDERLLESQKFMMVEVALDSEDFGLAPELLDEIMKSVTHIMHNAWQVNFNMSLSSFEADLKGIRNLINLAIRSPYATPPKVMFVSSIGAVGNYRAHSLVPEVPVKPSVALGSGYPESKWVAEKLLYNASKNAGVPTTAVRLGQVCGDRLGHWNEKEWFPSLVKSALFARCLPDMNGTASFIPSYPAARAFIEMRRASATVLHLVHPHAATWHELIAPIAQDLRVPLVPYAEWLEALERSASEEGSADEMEAMRANPALRLLDFFRAQSSVNGKEAMGPGGVQLSTEKAVRASETLANLPKLGPEDSRRWLAAWRASGFMQA
ncbi:acetyl-CoA synthetase-like protein [Daedaleopsis nitida]|nr:acetyl-CoA synthetase-like protein [Daedaleopsis nitida]